MVDDSFKARRTPRLRRAIVATLLVFVIAFLLAWFCIPPSTNNRPVSLQKDESGNWHNIGGEDSGAGLRLAAHAGSLKSSNNVSTGTVTSHPYPGIFSSRSVMILNHSEHLLMQRVGDELIERLRDRGQFDRVEYFPYGHVPPSGQLAPDLFVGLGLASIEESGLLQRDLKATVSFTLGTTLASSNYSVSDSYSPPTVSVFANSSVAHTSMMTGVESSAANYRLQGADISGQISKSIVETIEGLREKHDVDCELPNSFYGDWTPAPAFACLKGVDARVLTSLQGLCFHNETFWKTEPLDAPVKFVEQIHEELKGQGWSGKISDSGTGRKFHLRMSSGPQVLEVFPAREHSPFGSPITVKQDSLNENQVSQMAYVRYRRSMSEPERHAAYEQLLASGSENMEQLIALNRLASREQQQRLTDLIRESPPLLPEAWMLLARQYASQKRTSELEQALRNAYALNWCIGDAGVDDHQIKSLCKKHELDEKEIRKIDFNRVQSLGLPNVIHGLPPLDFTIHKGESIVVLVGGKFEWQVVTVRLQRVQPAGDRTFFTTVISQNSLDSRNIMRGTGDYASEHTSELRLEDSTATLAIKQAGDDSLRIRIELGF